MTPKRQFPPSSRAKGVALIIVLSMLALMTVLVIAFFTSVTTDYSSAKAYSRGESAKQLADSAVNVVMAQIKDATAGFARKDDRPENDLDTDKRLAWASQPGMIRTWDDKGDPANFYKLYSSDKMVVKGNAYQLDADTNDLKNVNGVGGKWNTQPAIYTDLNSPVLVRDGTSSIASSPIIDPNNLVDATSLNPAGPTNTLTYDANKDNKPDIEGFYVAKPETYTSGTVTPTNNPVPMPIKWLYVLQDGKLTAPTLSGSNAEFRAPQPIPTAQNPIVGRIAFWSDDESSKINVNTASEGIFWDVPVCASLDEMPFAGNPPTKGEFQRIPGHPAMTCLSPVLGNGTLDINHGNLQPSDLAAYKKIYDFTPRVLSGDADPMTPHGSQGGTLPITDKLYMYAPQLGDLKNNPTGQGSQTIVIPAGIATGTARLYSTVDDILFKPDRALQDTSVVNANTLKQDRFFLTANSRAPEVTLFNTPRVSLWPITWPYKSAHLSNNYATADRVPSYGTNPPNPDTQPLTDLLSVTMKSGIGKYMAPQEQLIAFCTQIGKDGTGMPFRYFFQRQNPDSPTYDYDNIKRNRELLGSYLSFLTDKNIPGFGANFKGKYGLIGRDSVLVNAFDAVRGVNMSTTGTNSSGKNSTLYDFTGMYYATAASGSTASRDQPVWQVAPMNINLGSGNTKSVGQFPTIPEVTLIFYATKRNDPYPVTSATSGTFAISNLISASNPQTTEMRMVVYLSEFTPGNPSISSSYWVRARGNSFTVNGYSIGFPADPVTGNVVQMKETQWLTSVGFVNRYFQSTTSHQYAPFTPKSFLIGGGTATACNRWEFVSAPIPLTPQNGVTNFSFGGSEVAFEIYGPNTANQNASPDFATAKPVQTIKIDFGALNNNQVPIPLAPRWTQGQGIPKEIALAIPSTSVVTTNTTSIPVTSSTTYYAWPFPGHNDISKNGIYLYQDEGFDLLLKSGTLPASPSRFPVVFNTKKNISTSWAVRMICATSDTSSYSSRCPDIPELAATTGTMGPMLPSSATYPKYYPSNLKNNNSGDSYKGATSIITPYDTVLSMTLDPKGPSRGDARVIAAMASVPPYYYTPACPGPSRDYEASPVGSFPRTTEGAQHHSLGLNWSIADSRSSNHLGSGQDITNPDDKISLLDAPMATVGYDTGTPYKMGKAGSGQPGEVNVAAFGRTVKMNKTESTPLGDWTNSSGNYQDGCYVWYPDQYYATVGGRNGSGTTKTEVSYVPFFAHTNTGDDVSQSLNFFSPNRQVSSGIPLLGTLPSPDKNGLPQAWQTLLFCPNPAFGTGHPGFGTIGGTVADHLLLDFFWMPVVEPYAISEPLSTAGKVNLNYQIVPFTDITRKTGLYGVMKSAKITAIPTGSGTSLMANYKSAYNMNTLHPSVSTRLNIDIAETLKDFDTKFGNNDIFRSASQICEMFLVPQGQNLGLVKGGGYWDTQKLTGDNSREAPYAHIYPRVTTKSNTFQVHYKVQMLKKRTRSNQAVWEEGKDQVVSEYRGSTILERYIDPNDSKLPDFATLAPSNNDDDKQKAVIDKYYRFRVVSTKAFMP